MSAPSKPQRSSTAADAAVPPGRAVPVGPRDPGLSRGFGRIPVAKVSPVIEGGAYPAKASLGESIPIRAKVFREGHDAVNATVVLTAPDGSTRSIGMSPVEPAGLDPWEAWVRPDAEGAWSFRVEAWSDPWATWLHHAEAKLPLEMDTDLVCAEGRDLFQRSAMAADAAGDPVAAAVLRANEQLLIPQRSGADLLDVATDRAVATAMAAHGPRELLTPSADFPLWVDRAKALFSSWYEFFPRSQGARFDPETDTWTSGSFDSCHTRLAEVAAMGFDVVYLPPIHPIGTAFRKGRNNTLTPAANDPGSPWAIGNVEGGHDAIHPDLGDFAAFDRFVAKARDLGVEIALDLALQASPDHPWVKEHPEWFTTRLDGTIAFAENPPKKYQDIYPINFDNDPAGIYAEVLRIVRLWISHGVRIFRVDNPHTKPVNFWGWLIEEVRRTDPDVLFLAEAFTRPEMMHALGKVGFHQSYTYFTWRTTKWEIQEYLGELTTQMDAFYRPNFFVNTPDINPFHLQSGSPAIFTIRAILAATLSPTWGVYSGFELFEHAPLRLGGEEYLDSEKFQYRPRDYQAEPNLNLLIGTLNRIRSEHPALQQLRQLHFHHALHENVIAFSKTDAGNTVLVVCSLDPDNEVESSIDLDLAALGGGPAVQVRDLLGGASYRWDDRAFVRLTPAQPAHILIVERD